jgi:hypothetical protein
MIRSSYNPSPLRRTLLTLGLLLLLANPALAARFIGVAQSDTGLSATLIVRVRLIGSKLVGRVRCKPGTLPCLFKRAKLDATVSSNATFSGHVGNVDVDCTIDGLVTFRPRRRTVTGLEEGRYTCMRADGVGDTGTFSVQ